MNRLKELREARGITMREAATLLNMPYTTYVNYEKGAREPNSETLILLADFYETTIDYMLCKTKSNDFFMRSEKQKSNSAPALILSEDEHELVFKYQQLTDLNKGRVLQQIDTLLDTQKQDAANSTQFIG